MTFSKSGNLIEDGDLVLAWINRIDVIPLRVTAGETLQTRYGPFRHDDLIGQNLGTQQPSMSGHGFIHILALTPELWALSLPHRTQIVYSPDASYIVSRLKIRPNSRVIEAGTGSGALTHALARTVSQKGRIWTYEYHEARCLQAEKEFADHGMADVVHITHRNVCEDGFELPGVDQGPSASASAVFLDLPAPWLAIPFLEPVLDRSAAVSICCFSPCIEQVIKTVQALRVAGFHRIEMVEIQAKRWEGHKSMVKTLDQALDVIKDIRVRRQEGMDRRHEERQQEEAAAGAGVAQASDTSSLKRKREAYNPWGKGSKVREGDAGFDWEPVSWMEPEIKSHTSYLTFAVLPPHKPAKYIK